MILEKSMKLHTKPKRQWGLSRLYENVQRHCYIIDIG